MGVNSFIMWAVIDPVMRAVITETLGSSIVETRDLSRAFSHWSNAWASHLVKIWASSSEFWPLQWSRDVSFDPCVLILQWSWGVAFKLCALAIAVMLRRRPRPLRLELREWLWLTLRLEYRLYFLMTCPQWFLDSLQNPSKVFETPWLTEMGFGILWTFLLAAILSRLD